MDLYFHYSVLDGSDTRMSHAIISQHQTERPTHSSYIAGFILSLLFTLGAYFLVVHHAFSAWTLVAWIVVFALAQFTVQLLLFLHLGSELRPRWRLLAFCFMAIVVAILVFGTLWIMHNLNYNMMSPQAINTYLNQQIQDGL